MKLKKKTTKKPSVAAFYMVVYKSQDEIEIVIAQGPGVYILRGRPRARSNDDFRGGG